MVGGKTTVFAAPLYVGALVNICFFQAISLRTGNRGEVPASFLARKASPVCVLGVPYLMLLVFSFFLSFSLVLCRCRWMIETPWRRGFVSTRGEFKVGEDPAAGHCLLSVHRYVGKKSRIEAEQALHYMRDGVFLIRESDVRPGEYAIALK